MQFYQPKELPKIMVAPNGVRPMKKDHPKVPITIDEIVETAKFSYEAGAEAIHFHIRHKNSQHILDANDCSEALIKLTTFTLEISYSFGASTDNLCTPL